jgi:hypothetical protein
MNLFVLKVLLFHLGVAIVITHPIWHNIQLPLSRNLENSKPIWNQGCEHEW